MEVVLYDPAGGGEETAVRRVCALARVRLRTVSPEDRGRAVGDLARGGRREETDGAETPASAAPGAPILVFCGFSQGRLDRMLAELRRAGVPRAVFKAVLTPDNAGWRFDDLAAELARERQAIEEAAGR